MAGRTASRGYGKAHQRLRAQWAPLVATGEVVCWRCERKIAADAPWDLGHDEQDRGVYRGPEHMACNRGAAGRKGSTKRAPEPHPNRRR